MKSALRSAALVGLLSLASLVLAAQAASDKPNPKTVTGYRIGVRDRLVVSITGEESLSCSGAVSAKGMITLKSAGEVSVYGLSIEEAQKAVTARFVDAHVLRHPQVIITAEELAPRQVTVTGAVKQAGLVNLPTETVFTARDAIMKARGLTDTAKGKSVRVSRTLPDGTNQVFEIDVASVLRGDKTESQPIPLQPGDRIFVPEKIF